MRALAAIGRICQLILKFLVSYVAECKKVVLILTKSHASIEANGRKKTKWLWIIIARQLHESAIAAIGCILAPAEISC
jgi:hypothetical protein